MYNRKVQLTPSKRKQISRRSGETPKKQPRTDNGNHDNQQHGRKLFSSQQEEGTPRRSQRTKRQNISYVDKLSSSEEDSDEDINDDDVTMINNVRKNKNKEKVDEITNGNEDVTVTNSNVDTMKDSGVEKMDVSDNDIDIEEFSERSSLEIDEDFRDFDAEEAKVSDTIPISSPDEVTLKMGKLSTKEIAVTQQDVSQVQNTQEIPETPQGTQETAEIPETQRSSQKLGTQIVTQNSPKPPKTSIPKKHVGTQKMETQIPSPVLDTQSSDIVENQNSEEIFETAKSPQLSFKMPETQESFRSSQRSKLEFDISDTQQKIPETPMSPLANDDPFKGLIDKISEEITEDSQEFQEHLASQKSNASRNRELMSELSDFSDDDDKLSDLMTDDASEEEISEAENDQHVSENSPEKRTAEINKEKSPDFNPDEVLSPSNPFKSLIDSISSISPTDIPSSQNSSGRLLSPPDNRLLCKCFLNI